MRPALSKVCTKCATAKPLDQYSKAPRGLHGTKSTCKACDAARHQALGLSRALPPDQLRSRIEARRGDTKQCAKCKAIKTRAEFSKSRDGKYGPVLRSWCKPCSSVRAYRWFLDHRERAIETQRRYNRLKFFGLTQEAFEELMRSQGGLCAICGRDEEATHPRTGSKFYLAVDHCHQTGLVRGLLCQRCNRAMGMFGDDPQVMQKAIDYLLLHRGEADDQGGP